MQEQGTRTGAAFLKRGLFACLFLCLASLLVAADYSIPAGLDPFAATLPAGTAHGYSQPYGSIYGFPVFRVWGWSADGKLAWSVERAIEGRGGWEVTYVVQDLVSDEVVWRLVDDSEDWEGGGMDVEAAGVMAFSYARNRALVSGKFSSLGVKQLAVDYAAFPATIGGHGFACRAETKVIAGLDSDAGPGAASLDYRIVIRRDNRSEKTVTAVKGARALSVRPCGYLKSPFENRVAIIIAEERFVFEGSELFYSIAGCNLVVGF